MLEDQRSEARHFELVTDLRCLVARETEEDQRRAIGTGFVMPFHGQNLGGWCSSVLSPWASPARICIGVTIAAIHIAIENILRAPALVRSRSKCQAPTTANHERRRQIGCDHGVDEAIWKARSEDDRDRDPAGTNWSFALIAQSAGVCIQLFRQRSRLPRSASRARPCRLRRNEDPSRPCSCRTA